MFHRKYSVDIKASYDPPKELSAEARINSTEQYQSMYKRSLENPPEFWQTMLNEANFKFQRPYDLKRFWEYNFDTAKGPIFTKWMPGASTNVCYNCLDRNVERGLGNKIAFYWEGNRPNDHTKITYNELLEEVCKFANVLKKLNVKKGDRVVIYLPMIIELPVVMLACARIGAVHSIVFGGFSCEALASRILDAGAEIIITANGFFRGTNLIALKNIVEEAISMCRQKNHTIKQCIVVKHLCNEEFENVNIVKGYTDFDSCNGSSSQLYKNSDAVCRSTANLQVKSNPDVDVWYHKLMSTVPKHCDVEWLDAEDPLFMLYTSGSTGKPKGVLHTQAGYMLYTYTTFRYVFDYKDDDIYFCTADIGWITGHSYVTYGPLLNGATGIIFEGVPFYPDSGRLWDIVDKYAVTKLYTAPTAIRSLMKDGDDYVKKYSRKTLKILGTVGEPINPAAWLWYFSIVGEDRCPIVDTYWQTETGGHVITPLPGCTVMKPGSATLPFFGVDVVMLDEDGSVMEGPGEGYLAFKKPWPGMMRTVYGDHDRFEKTYFSKFPGYYCTADGCRRDKDGYYWITGRVDDMMNVSGHLLSTAEIESAMVSHKSTAEAAVVPQPHDIKGNVPYCFVTLKKDVPFTVALVDELKGVVKRKIGPLAVPAVIQNAPALPKTRSGKIMRRILRKIASGDIDDLGDLTTLADENVIKQLLANRPSLPTVGS